MLSRVVSRLGLCMNSKHLHSSYNTIVKFWSFFMFLGYIYLFVYLFLFSFECFDIVLTSFHTVVSSAKNAGRFVFCNVYWRKALFNKFSSSTLTFPLPSGHHSNFHSRTVKCRLLPQRQHWPVI